MTQLLLELFKNKGMLRGIAGNHPLSLDDPNSVWLIGAGPVDVFAVPSPNDDIPGSRLHLFRAEMGQLLFGVRPPGQEDKRIPGSTGSVALSLVVVGSPGSHVYQLRREQLDEMISQPALVKELAPLLDGWIEGLTRGGRGGLVPQNPILLEPQKEVKLPDGGITTPTREVLWVRHVQGTSLFLGKTDLPAEAVNGLFPLADTGWLAARDANVVLTTMTTEEALGAAPITPPPEGRRRTPLSPIAAWYFGLECFHKLVLNCVLANVADTKIAERNRHQRRAEYERLLVGTTLARLADVTEAGEPEGLEGPQEDPLLRACRVVGARLGVAIQPPIGLGDTGKRSDPVSAIARASHVRTRRVLLAGDWWFQDNGPLLAFLEEGNRPVALLPTSPSRYEQVDPSTSTRTPLTAAGAAHIAPFAYQFYRPFPFRPLSPWDLFRFSVRGSGRDWFFVILFGLAGSILGMFTPIVTGWIFDRIIPETERNQLLLVILALTVSAVSVALFQVTRGIAVLRLETHMDSAVEAGLWDRLLNLPVPFFRRYTAGDLAMRAMGISAIRQVLTYVALSAMLGFLFSLVSFGLLFYYDTRLAFLALFVFVLILVVAGVAAFMQLRIQRGISQARGKIAGFVLQLITGIARLRVAGAENRALAVWAREFSVQKKLAFQARSIANNLAAFNSVVPLVTMMAVFLMVINLSANSLSLGDFLAFSVAFTQILAAAILMASVMNSIVEIVPLYERAKPILQALPEVDGTKAIPFDVSGDIELSHVSFRYQADSPLILNDVSFHIRAGEFVAIVGPSGAGKSTLIRLLLGFETPTAGSVYYDNEDLTRLDCQAVRRQIGVVLQDGKVTTGNIFDNIVGSYLLTQEDAWEAARLSGLADDIQQMPMGMQTIVSEGGSTLSGGQRQRLMIARAVVSKPRILLFDEATAALDNETQATVSRSLENLKATRVVVAHRLSTIRYAERIYVMEGGRIVQQGQYEDLLQQGGVFAQLVQRQLL